MGTVSGVAGGLAATDPKLVPYGALTATFHTGIGCLVGPSIFYLTVAGAGRLRIAGARDQLMHGEFQKIDSGLLSDRIRNALTDAITAGELQAGTALDEQNLAQRYGASRTPVREACASSRPRGWWRSVRGGAWWWPADPERIADMFETTAEIEAMCARLAT